MGLDMYAYVASKKGQQNEYYETAEFDKTVNEFVSTTVTKPYEIAYWRKHPNLHGWMQRLWERKGKPGGYDVNCQTQKVSSLVSLQTIITTNKTLSL